MAQPGSSAGGGPGPYGNLLRRGTGIPNQFSGHSRLPPSIATHSGSPAPAVPLSTPPSTLFPSSASPYRRTSLPSEPQTSYQSDRRRSISGGSLSLERSDQNKRRREQRSYEPAFFKETVASHAEGRKPKHNIPTNEQGKIVGLRTKWHGTCRSIAKRLINWTYPSYAKHQGEWKLLCATVQRELDTLFSYSPTDLDPNYLSKYLDDAIAHDKSIWRQFFYDRGLQHEDCPDEAWQSCMPYWDSEEGREKSKLMQSKRALGSSGPSRTASGNSRPLPTSSSPSVAEDEARSSDPV